MMPLWLHEVDMGIPESSNERLPRTIDHPHSLWNLISGLPDADDLSVCNDNDRVRDWLRAGRCIDASPDQRELFARTGRLLRLER
jgi:hypothetical protein